MAQLIRDHRAGCWLARRRDPSGHQRKRSFALKSTPNAGSTRPSHWVWPVSPDRWAWQRNAPSSPKSVRSFLEW